MKIGKKESFIIFLIGIVCLMAGVLISQKSSTELMFTSNPADDGKLAKSYKEENLVAKIRDKAKDLQACYFTYLDTSPEVKEGVVKILFKVEENGQVGKVQVTDNNFKNEKLADCILEKFKNVYLSPPPLGINRFLSHDLAFKLEETAIKDAKERELRNTPPKVLPVN